MLNVNMLLAGNLWHTLISLMAKWIVNYGWAIILFTVFLKLVMSPLDFFQRRASSKQQKMMSKMQPEMEALQKKYGNDKEKLNQETAKLYKKHNVSLGGMCFSMLGTMIISMVVFFTLFSALRSYGNEKLYESYSALDSAYVQVVEKAETESWTEEEKNNQLTLVVKQKYDELSKQNSWLWVKNVWKSDTNTSQFVDVNDYIKHNGIASEGQQAVKDRYDHIVKIVDGEKTTSNGYYILLILAVTVSFLTQFLSAKLMTPKGQKFNTMNKVMFAVIPLSMMIFALTSNAVFTLYIITNSVMTAIISTILFFVNRSKQSNGDIIVPKRDVQVVEYSRNYKK